MKVNDTLPIGNRSSVWAMIDGSLHECVATGFVWLFTDDERHVIKYNLKVKDTDKSKMVSPNDMYLSEKAYVEGSPISKLPYSEIYVNETYGKCKVNEKTWEGTFFIFQDSTPTKVTKKIKMLTFDYQTGNVKFSFYDFNTDLPYYASYEECLVYNDYSVTLKDGTVVKRESIVKMLALNDDQEQIVKELEGILDKAHKAGINLIFDTETDELYATNRDDRVSWSMDDRGIDYNNWRWELPKVSSHIFSTYGDDIPSVKLD